MSAHTFWQILDHCGQLAYEWLESSYGTAKMGTFILSYGCDQPTWTGQMDTLDSLLAWLGAFLPIAQAESPWLWGCLYTLHVQEQTINDLLRKVTPWLPVQPPEPQYPTLPLDPATWFLE